MQRRIKGQPPPPFEKKKLELFFLENFYCIYAKTLIFVNMRGLQNVYFLLLF